MSDPRSPYGNGPDNQGQHNEWGSTPQGAPENQQFSAPTFGAPSQYGTTSQDSYGQQVHGGGEFHHGGQTAQPAAPNFGDQQFSAPYGAEAQGPTRETWSPQSNAPTQGWQQDYSAPAAQGQQPYAAAQQAPQAYEQAQQTYSQAQQPYGQAQQAPAFGGYPAQPGQPGYPVGDGFPAQQSKKGNGKKIALIVGAIAAVLLLVGGIGGWMLFQAKVGGANSAQGSVEKTLKAASSINVEDAILSLAPSETDMVKDALQKVTKDDKKDLPDGVPSLDQSIKDLQRELKTKHENLKFTEEEIKSGSTAVPDVKVVEISEGKIVFEGDSGKVAEAMQHVGQAVAYQTKINAGVANDEAAAEARKVERPNVTLPRTMTFRNGGVESGSENGSSIPEHSLKFVTVHEGSGWYVSPIMTGLHSAITSQASLMGGASSKAPATEVKPVIGANTPEEAGLKLVEGIRDTVVGKGDGSAVAGMLPKPERRILSLYGLPFVDQLHSSTSSTMSRVKVDISGGFKKTDFAGPTSILPDHLKVKVTSADSGSSSSSSSRSSRSSRGEAMELELDGQCASMQGKRQCLTDLKPWRALGLDRVGFVVEQEDGKWVVSVFKTTQQALSTAADNYVKLRNEGRLSELTSV